MTRLLLRLLRLPLSQDAVLPPPYRSLRLGLSSHLSLWEILQLRRTSRAECGTVPSLRHFSLTMPIM
jgi:hypothetical protein